MRIAKALSFVAVVLLLPTAVHAQASVTGVVRDSSGAVLPGVTAEVASGALIEKVRSSVTDGSGRYRIVDLVPGVYTVTFSLPGFTKVVRGGIELAGTFTATVNAELAVGNLEETITITGTAPIVNIQSAQKEDVLNQGVLTSIPAARNLHNIAVLIPGVRISGTADVGG